MKRTLINLSLAAITTVLLMPSINAQEEKEKEKDKKDEKKVDQIIITHKGDKDNKVVIEFKNDQVIINGKPVDEFKDDDLTIHRNRMRDLRANNYWNFGPGENFLFDVDENRAMLGVTTEKEEEGVEITQVTEKSAAEKAGLKNGDIITKINNTKIEDPDDLSKAVREHKPGEKVTITFLRDKKEQKVTAELGKWKGFQGTFNFEGPEMNFDINPHIQAIPKISQDFRGNRAFWYGSGPRLGVSVQDSEDGKGVKVIEVDEEGNAAKAGVKEDDVITHVNDKEVNSADEVAKIVKENKEKVSIMLKVNRNGKTQNIEVKMPRKLKTADL